MARCTMMPVSSLQEDGPRVRVEALLQRGAVLGALLGAEWGTEGLLVFRCMALHVSWDWGFEVVLYGVVSANLLLQALRAVPNIAGNLSCNGRNYCGNVWIFLGFGMAEPSHLLPVGLCVALGFSSLLQLLHSLPEVGVLRGGSHLVLLRASWGGAFPSSEQ